MIGGEIGTGIVTMTETDGGEMIEMIGGEKREIGILTARKILSEDLLCQPFVWNRMYHQPHQLRKPKRRRSERQRRDWKLGSASVP